MNTIPPATAAKLATPYPEGTRHQAALEIAIPLLGSGLPPAAVFATLRSKFPADVSDRELQDVVSWSARLNPQPAAGGNGREWKPKATAHSPALPARSPQEQANWWCPGGITPDEMMRQSPVRIPDSPKEYASLALSSLYQEQDRLNVICKYILEGDKAKPHGGGMTMGRNGWINYFNTCGVPDSKAGAWVRPNPCKEKGSGADGAVTDADVLSYRYALLESDTLPLDKQLILFTRWKLPVAAVILSGGHSAHAWVRLEAETAERYKELAGGLIDMLVPFGIDRGNKNASRLSRLPGAVRVIGAENGGQQRLLYLNPNAKGLTAESLKRFQESLRFPCVVSNPLREMAQEAMTRYEWMRANRGKLGVPSGIPKLDKLSGGLKNGQTTVAAGATGAGKTTMALHIALSALRAGYGVALFSLEMDKEEIFDLLMSNVCSIDRNKFNTGDFHDSDFDTMAKGIPGFIKLPLYIEDQPSTTIEQIRARVFQLKADANIGLVIVDYIQFINPEWSKDSREQQVAQISHGLRALAREVDLPMVVLSQLNEEGKLRESRVIAHNAHTVMLVDVDAGDDFKILITKGRSIPKGEYHMRFDRIYNRLRSVDDPPPQTPHAPDP